MRYRKATFLGFQGRTEIKGSSLEARICFVMPSFAEDHYLRKSARSISVPTRRIMS